MDRSIFPFLLFASTILADTVPFYLKKEAPLDPTIHFEEIKPDSLYAEVVAGLAAHDKKWLVTFHEIVGEPPFSVLMKRIRQEFVNEFLPVPVISSSQVELAKKTKTPFSICVSSQGYLPGERITFKIISHDERSKQVSFFPIPLRTKTDGGEMIAELTSASGNLYDVTILPANPDEEYELRSFSVAETFTYQLKGPRTVHFSLGAKGHPGGSCVVKTRFLSGTPCRLELLWGYRLTQFLDESTRAILSPEREEFDDF